MTDLPAGTVTLLFTDVQGSTELAKALGEKYSAVLATHRDLLREAFATHGGTEVDTQGDAFFVVFRSARDAVVAAIDAQRALVAESWPGGVAVSVRMGLHTGAPFVAEHGYTGVAVHRAARICTIAHGGQVLLSRSTAGIVDDERMAGVGLRDLGAHLLKDFDSPEPIYQLIADGLPAEFPPPVTADRQLALTGTVTIVMVEGRRMVRLVHELSSEDFGALLGEYQRLLRGVFEATGGREVEVAMDTVTAAFPTAKQAALAAVAARRAVAGNDWPSGPRPEVSIGLHSGEAGVGWLGPAVLRCLDLCDTAEGGQIFMSQATAGLLEDDDLGGLVVRDLGERRTRRARRALHAYELVVPSP